MFIITGCLAEEMQNTQLSKEVQEILVNSNLKTIKPL